MNSDQAQELWEKARGLLANREETNSPMAKVYLDYLVPLSVDENSVVFSIRLLHVKSWIESKYLSVISDAYFALLGNEREIKIEFDENADSTIADVPAGAALTSEFAAIGSVGGLGPQPHPAPQNIVQITPEPILNTAISTSAPEASTSTGLGSIFSPDPVVPVAQDSEKGLKSFDNFVVGDSNDYAYSAAQRVAEYPGQYINPLFVYGRSGLGKTHLQLAIKNYINLYHPEKIVVYAPTMEFVNDFTTAIADDRNLTNFKLKYHTCDVLLLDDVQYLEGKDATISALFEIFNMFIDQHKQIVLSADRSPSEINLDERFTSRFASGVTAGIQPPSYEMKAAIFMNYKTFICTEFKVPDIVIPDEVIQFIIERSGSNIRELEGAVTSIVGNIAFKPNHSGVPITVDEAESIIGKIFTANNVTNINIHTIQQAIESYYNVSHTDLLSDKRSKNISHPRQVGMYLSRQLTNNSFPEIGKSFGNKDHTSAMYAVKNIQKKLVANTGIKGEVERLKEIITS